MFKRELSNQLLRMINEKNLTVTSVAELAHISREYLTKVISQKHNPSIDVLENLCSALEVEPNDLLMNEKSKTPLKSIPLEVAQIRCTENTHTALCPVCEKKLLRDYQAYCDYCGQKLSWKKYRYANTIYVGDVNEKPNRENQKGRGIRKI